MQIRRILSSFGLKNNEIDEITKNFQTRTYQPDETVFNEGDKSDKFYLIESGQAMVSRKTQTGDKEVLNVLQEGQCFGEIGILEEIERTASVSSIGLLELFEMSHEKFLELMENKPAFAQLLRGISIRRLLRQIAMFKDLDEDSINSIQSILCEETYPDGKIIFEENDPPDALYIIVKGNVRIYRKLDYGKEVTLAYFSTDDFFGEQGLIESMPRSANAVTTEETRFIIIRNKDFQALLQKNAMISFNILKVLSQRMRETSKEMAEAKGVSYFKGMTIVSRPDRCLSCRTCEIACAVAKSRTHNLYEAISEEPLPVKRIRLKVEQSGSGPVVRPEHCIHCKDAPCLTSCKFDAIKRDLASGTIAIVDEKCVGCGACGRSCPFNVITMIRTEKKKRVALKCTYCHEHQAGPACVRSCPTNALVVALAPNV